ncbi:MAG: ester cyclase [Ignavibacteria bacterium]
MSIENNKTIVKNFYDEVINEKKIESIEKYLTDDFIHNGEKRGIEGQKEAVKIFLTAFSNLVNTIEIFLGESDLVCVHESWIGKHTGDFMGVAPTNKQINWTSTAILKIRDNKISQTWDENDFLGLFQQMGKYPDNS